MSLKKVSGKQGHLSSSIHFRLVPLDDFALKIIRLDNSDYDLVMKCIDLIENGDPVVRECESTKRRCITHKKCNLYFTNDSLLDFEFI